MNDVKYILYCQDEEITVTFGLSEDLTEYRYQTGDNSFSGPAYFYPIWAVVTLDPESIPSHVARESKDQARELGSQAIV